MTDEAVTFDCRGCRLLGVMHRPEKSEQNVAFVFVVGGPQYRVGSHRMFVELARELARNGAWVLRFDCRGMGDSDGSFVSFEEIDDDIRSAIDATVAACPGTRVVLLGLCDGASASAMYAPKDQRVTGLVLLNPWVRTEEGEARARTQLYYPKRALQLEFWRRLLTGKVHVRSAIRSLGETLRRAWRTERDAPGYIDRMRLGLEAFGGRVLIVLSDDDLTAREFADLSKRSTSWKALCMRPKLTLRHRTGCDHTFSAEGQVERLAREIATFA
jgi:uncharacterized protein